MAATVFNCRYAEPYDGEVFFCRRVSAPILRLSLPAYTPRLFLCRQMKIVSVGPHPLRSGAWQWPAPQDPPAARVIRTALHREFLSDRSDNPSQLLEFPQPGPPGVHLGIPHSATTTRRRAHCP